jgi:hypothetical protein
MYGNATVIISRVQRGQVAAYELYAVQLPFLKCVNL